MKEKYRGFEEVEHTADWAYRVWAESLSELFIEAAGGLYQLAGVELTSNTQYEKEIQLRGIDLESLLIAWLNELLHLRNSENLGCSNIEIMKLDSHSLEAKLTVSPIARWIKDIKAATYHNLVIQQTELGFEVTIVLDV
jgi:SHS2 domain-containing protein